LEDPDKVEGVPECYLNPRGMWENPLHYDKVEQNLVNKFKENFKRFGDYSNQELVETIRGAGPR
jgi:phosphoenolpyruvate carboxykinase (ATP)